MAVAELGGMRMMLASGGWPAGSEDGVAAVAVLGGVRGHRRRARRRQVRASRRGWASAAAVRKRSDYLGADGGGADTAPPLRRDAALERGLNRINATLAMFPNERRLCFVGAPELVVSEPVLASPASPVRSLTIIEFSRSVSGPSSAENRGAGCRLSGSYLGVTMVMLEGARVAGSWPLSCSME